jgi:hypothetical protein
MSHSIPIPAAFRPVLTEALLTALQSAAEGVERAGFDPETYPEPLEQFDRVRAALDALGWGARGEIDVETHRAVLVQALRVALELERDHIADADRMSSNAGAAEQHDRASAAVAAIEAWAASAGLELTR